MFIYDNIPDIKLSEVVDKKCKKIYEKLPQKLIDVCQGLENDKNFYSNRTRYSLGSSKVISDMHKQILLFLESHNAIKYSINDSLLMAGIKKPLAITFYNNHEELLNQPLRVKDISTLYHLASGNLWLPPHHVAAMTLHGHIPETVAEILRDYIEYVFKCEDKDFGDLLREIITLANNKVIDDNFYAKLTKEKSQKTVSDYQNQPS